MEPIRTNTETLIASMYQLSNDIQTAEGVIEAAIREAADRLQELYLRTPGDEIALFAFRYALGRMTYAPEMVVSYIVAAYESLSDATVTAIKRELDEELERDKRRREAGKRGSIGDECDRETWERLQEFIDSSRRFEQDQLDMSADNR